MSMKGTTGTNIRYTAVLPEKDVLMLKELVSSKVIPSVNSGIREAIESYIETCKRERYARLMQEAAQDKEFMKRTMDAQNAFREVDGAVGGEW